MSKSSTKPADIAKALSYLQTLLNSGVEFPDAAWRAACALRVDYVTLCDAYDAASE